MTLAEIFRSDLRGHDYIKARGLTPQAITAQQHHCETCRQAELLPAVLQIINAWPVKAKPVRRVK